ncbi:MAG: UDP-N-acetylmuramate--L-alanine ligase [Chloroflexi bacterium]|nr:UDP-N-acetylmuramate--L-alanine ligase [Chloroflexota bacterium]
MNAAPGRLLGADVRRVHVVGIAGAGMSGVAAALIDLELQVSGSDLRATAATGQLESRGARIHRGHDAGNVTGADLVVHSAAVPSDNVELVAARSRSVPVASRAAIIAELFNASRGIAVAGTHGKSTTSAMIAAVLRETGRDPSFLLGAASPSLDHANGRYRRDSWMVVEADEFDSAFLAYRPEIAVITNLERDHLDYFGTEARMVEAFAAFAAGLPADARLIARGDVAHLRRVAAGAPTPALWFGPDEAWDLETYTPAADGCAVEFRTPHGPVACRLPLRGRHNAWNALAALMACTLAGVPASEVARAIESFGGVERRLQLRACGGGVRVLEDYAHHPTAVRATIAAAREFTHRRLWAIYQPLLRSRTLDLLDDFVEAFAGADRVTFAEIYSPPGRERGVEASSALLAARVRHSDASFLPSFDAIADLVAAEAAEGDVILVMGPDSVTPLADRISVWVETRAAA